MSDYKIRDLEQILTKNINAHTDIAFVAGDLGVAGSFDSKNKFDLLNAISASIFKASNDNATIMTQTMSFQICNTNTPFERYTPSNLGAFGNFLLNTPNSVRSLHPFASYTALGKNAKICNTSTPHAYGIASPYHNMLEFDKILMISIGMRPNLTCSLIHHVEFVMNVPYRYIKEFYHPIKINDEITYKNFYLQVLYEPYRKLTRDENVKIFKYFTQVYKQSVREFNLGKSAVFVYDYKAFYKACVELFSKDIYAWMKQEPKEKPYRI